MNRKDQLAPKARKNKLIVKELESEVLVYDENNHKAHCLNKTAALVWKFCDGRTSIPKMTRLLEKETSAAVPEQAVWLAIKQLEETRLLEPLPKPAWLPQTSRRELIRRVGIAAVTLPLITSVYSATAATAGSCRTVGQTCAPPSSNPGTCCSGLNCNSSGICQVS